MKSDAEHFGTVRNHSIYGTGLRWMSLEQVSPDKVNATLWLTLIYIPLIPLQRWLCRFAGYDASIVFLAHEVESPLLHKLERTQFTLSSILSTYLWALVTCCFLFGPIAFMTGGPISGQLCLSRLF